MDAVLTFLGQERFRAAVIGGVALAAYGNPRLTLDLDIVTDAAAQERVVEFMEARGYATLHRSAGYTNHLHASPARGRVDFMYVRDQTAERLFAGTTLRSGPGGRTISVPKPEHLIAMKVQAIKDAPERALQDLADVAHLLQVAGVDRDEAHGYFTRAGLEERWRELIKTL
jgi:hypothetical protein